jgi:hypothetical protein
LSDFDRLRSLGYLGAGGLDVRRTHNKGLEEVIRAQKKGRIRKKTKYR